MMNVRKLFLAALCAAPLGACALADVASSPAPNLYVLTAAHSQPGENMGQTSAQLLVDEFSAASVIDTSRIVFQPGDNEIKYYKDARWSDSVPRMIQDLLVETLQNTGRFAAVAEAGSELRSDFKLMGDIRSFGAVENANGTNVRVALLVQLVRASDRSIVSSRSFSSTVAPVGSGMGPVIAAYDAAMRQVLNEVSLWTLDEAARAAPALRPVTSTRTHGAVIVPNATLKSDAPYDIMNDPDDPL